MQDGFFQKLTLCVIVSLLAAGLVEFYRTFVTGADQALNGSRKAVHMRIVTTPQH